MTAVAVVAALAALGLVLAAAIVDVVRYEIPDGISIAIAALAVVFGLVTPGFAWVSHAAAAGGMFAFGLLAFSRGWLGGGDVKVMTAVAAWTALAGLPLMFVATSVAGGALVLVYGVGRRVSRVDRTVAATAPLPYAVAIAAGTLWWLWATRGGPLPIA